MKSLKLATYNVNGVRGRLPRLLEWLAETAPDVACLQEIKTSDDRVPAVSLEAAGYRTLWHGQRAHHGVAILARHALHERRRGLPGDADGPREPLPRSGRARHRRRVGVPAQRQSAARTPVRLQARVDRAAAQARHVVVCVDLPVVLAGDFNVVPTNFDIYNPKSWLKDALLQPASRGCWQRLLAQGWTDSIRHLHPDERIYTFWDYFRQHWQRDSGLRIDHILLNEELKPRLESAGVDKWVRGQEGASDHAPTWVALKPASPRKRAR